MQNPQDVQRAASALKERLPEAILSGPRPPIGIILGTGLSGIIEQTGASLARIPFADLPGFPLSSVESHAGCFAVGIWQNLPVLIQQGRCHLYEGRTPAEVCMGTRIMAAMGCKTLIITNAAGALNPLFRTPGLMCICDIINHTGASPLTGPNHAAWGERFPDLSQPFNKDLINTACATALKLALPLEKGVYIGVAGPEMETPAETRMYRQWGADAIGMSTALEVIAARHLGLDCLGLSCLTNKNLPDCMAGTSFEQILGAAKAAGADLLWLLAGILAELAKQDQAGNA